MHRPYPPGGDVDGPNRGTPPGTWDVFCEKTELFEEKVYKITMPHTEEVRTCWRCHGAGQVRCGRCNGRGYNSHTYVLFCFKFFFKKYFSKGLRQKSMEKRDEKKWGEHAWDAMVGAGSTVPHVIPMANWSITYNSPYNI